MIYNTIICNNTYFKVFFNSFVQLFLDRNICYIINRNKKYITNYITDLENIKFLIKYPDKLEEYIYIIENTNINIIHDKNISIDLIEKYAYKWDYMSLSKNPNLTEDFILKYPHQNWDIDYLIRRNIITDFKVLSKFKNIYSYIIDKYPNKPWDWEWLIENTDINIKDCIPFDLIEKYKDKWDYYFLSRNPNLTEEFIMKYPYKNWNIIKLIKNNKITDFKVLSKFININKDILYNYLDKPWDWKWLIENTHIQFKEKYWYLSRDLSITEEFILKQPYQNWNIKWLIENNKITNFKALTKFKYINRYIIYDYRDKPWDWEWLIENTDINVEKYISLELIKKYSCKWNYGILSYNPSLTEEFILKYPNKDWFIDYLIKNNKITNFNALSKFKYINQNIIKKYLDKPWDWDWIINNSNIDIEYYISLELIKKYSCKWNYWILSYNPNLIEKFILKYPYKNWNIKYLIENNKINNFKVLSKFININEKIINEYLDKPWDWDYIKYNTYFNIKNNILNIKKFYKV